MNKIIDRTGILYTTNQGYEIEIIEYSSRKSSIKFKDGSILKDRCFKQVSRYHTEVLLSWVYRSR
jgi:hypothetical protein